MGESTNSIHTAHQRAVSADLYQMLLLSNSPWLRVALAAAFAPEFTIHTCGETKRHHLTSALASTQPDVILIDLIGEGRRTVQVLGKIHTWSRRVPIFALAAERKSRPKEHTLSAALAGFISWSDSIESVQRAIQEACEKNPGRKRGREIPSARQARSSPAPRPSLSKRELQVFDLIGQGCTTIQISSALRLSVSTVETYRERIKLKLSLDNSVELLQRAIRWARFGVWSL